MLLTQNVRNTRRNISLSSFFMALHFHGIGLYFILTGLINYKPSWLTATFRILSLVLFCLLSLNIKEYKVKLKRIRVYDAFYILFILLALLEMRNVHTPFGYSLPITFALYSLSLLLLRAATCQQIRSLFYFTTLLTTATSFISLLQFLSVGIASLGDGRIYLGTSGNPIGAGYTGAYACSCCLLLVISEFNRKYNSLFMLLGSCGLILCILSGTRSSILFCFFSSTFILINSINFSRILSFRLFRGQSLKLVFLLGFLILAPIFFDKSIEFQSFDLFQSIQYTIDRFLDTFYAIINNSDLDASAFGRVEDYKRTYDTFVGQPLFGLGVYQSGYAHNFVLQAAADFGILGLTLFVFPFIVWGIELLRLTFHSLRKNSIDSQYKKTNIFVLRMFFAIIFFQTILNGGFHGDLYRTFFLLSGTGILLAINNETWFRRRYLRSLY